MSNKIYEFTKQGVSGAASAASLQYGLKLLPHQIVTFSGHAFKMLPRVSAFAPAITGLAFFVVSRGIDRFIVEKGFGFKADNKCTNFQLAKKQVVSATLTVLTGAVAGTVLALATGTTVVPSVISVAALAALVWLATKLADVAIALLEFLAHQNKTKLNNKGKLTEEELNELIMNNGVDGKLIAVSKINLLEIANPLSKNSKCPVNIHKNKENEFLDYDNQKIDEKLLETFKPHVEKELNTNLAIVDFLLKMKNEDEVCLNTKVWKKGGYVQESDLVKVKDIRKNLENVKARIEKLLSIWKDVK
jgi:hypothetical protein